jgi:hypothetical protein
MRIETRLRALVVAIAALVLAACAAQTSFVNQWETPNQGTALRKIFVVGVFANASVRRTFEDQMVAALAARGVEAVPSHRLIQQDGPVDSARMDAAVRESGADGVITTRVQRIDRQQRLVSTTPSSAMWGPPMGFRSWHGSAWGPGPWGPAFVYPSTMQVVTTDNVVAEVRLFRSASDELVWAATTSTFSPTNPERDSASFSQTIVNELAQRRLI